MSTIASVHIDEYGGKFIVVGQFGKMSMVSSPAFDNLRDALREMAKIIQREELRYESGFRGDFDR